LNTVFLLKTVQVKNVDRQQTFMILPLQFAKAVGVISGWVAEFQQLDRESMLLTLLGPHDRAYNRTYKVVENNGSWHTSVPRTWLRNCGAREGDRLDVYSTTEPNRLIVKLRKMI
jgi:hypothetical protein